MTIRCRTCCNKNVEMCEHIICNYPGWSHVWSAIWPCVCLLAAAAACHMITIKIGGIASEEFVLQLVESKCISSLLYGLEACALTKSELSSLDFTVNRFFMKLFRTGNIEVVKNCQACFEFSSPSVLWAERVKKFEAKFVTCDRTFIHYGHCMN